MEFGKKLTFLRGLIGSSPFANFVRQTYPTAKSEVLYPHDAALNQIVNFPTGLDAREPAVSQDGELHRHGWRQSGSSAAIDLAARESRIPAGAIQRHLFGISDDATRVGARAVACDRGRLRIGGSLRARSVLSDRAWPTDEHRIAAGKMGAQAATAIR